MNNSDKNKHESKSPRRSAPLPREERKRLADERAEKIKKRFLEIQELIRQGKPLPKVY
jgi:hypothetical protein